MSSHYKSKKVLANAIAAADGNNNEEKYSLRRKRKANSGATQDGDDCDAKPAKGKNKAKAKAAPLSKYRRKTANARERTRMREINTAFETLRTFVPLVVSGVPANEPSTNEKLTKITTLRLAMKYITILSDILEAPSDTVDQTFGPIIDSIHNVASPTAGIVHTNNNNEDHNYNSTDHLLHLNQHQHNTVRTSSKSKVNNSSSLSRSDISVYDTFDEIMLTPSPPSTNNSKTNKKSKTNKTSKQTRKKSKKTNGGGSTKTSNKKTNSNKSVTIAKRNTNNQQQQTKNQQKLAKIMKNIDLTPCLTLTQSGDLDDYSLDIDLPLEDEVHSLHLVDLVDHTVKMARETYNCKTNHYSDSLELGLLLESDGESLNMSEPCLSPLSQLDSFNPFSDLLHTDFNEQAALEMFLT